MILFFQLDLANVVNTLSLDLVIFILIYLFLISIIKITKFSG
jgi:hypothetical protein